MKSEGEEPAVSAADRRHMWEAIKSAGIVFFLIFCDVQDIKEKQLSVKMLILFGSLFLVLSLLFDRLSYEQRVYSLLPGAAALLLAFLTREQIGYGDAVCLVILGTVMTGDMILGAVMGGLVLVSAYSIVLLVRKKADRRTTLPFLPFLTAGVLWQMIF